MLDAPSVLRSLKYVKHGDLRAMYTMVVRGTCHCLEVASEGMHFTIQYTIPNLLVDFTQL